MAAARKRWMSARLAGASALLVSALVAAGASPAAAQSPTMSVSPRSGTVGTPVILHGNAGLGCNAGSFPTLTFGLGTTGPVEFIVVPVAPDGSWKASFVIPPFVGGAATRGGYGADVTSGAWLFQGPTCNGRVAPEPSVPFQVTGTSAARPATRFVGMTTTADGKGYWLTQASGGVSSFGDARFFGSLPSGPGGRGVIPAAPISGIAATHDGAGYWLVGQDGGVYAFGDARFYGSLPSKSIRSSGVVVGITPTPDGAGYWLVGADGGVFNFGDAAFYGSPKLSALAITALVATPDGKGYLTMPANGDAPLTNGDATLPSGRVAGPMTLDALISGGAITADGHGFWEVGTDGGVFAFGDASFRGSLPGSAAAPSAPIVGMAATPTGGGYWLLGADGGVFSFGDAGFHGSAASSGLPW
jgi:hypothetical protein